jgi:hypothetical protein
LIRPTFYFMRNASLGGGVDALRETPNNEYSRFCFCPARNFDIPRVDYGFVAWWRYWTPVFV